MLIKFRTSKVRMLLVWRAAVSQTLHQIRQERCFAVFHMFKDAKHQPERT